MPKIDMRDNISIIYELKKNAPYGAIKNLCIIMLCAYGAVDRIYWLYEVLILLGFFEATRGDLGEMPAHIAPAACLKQDQKNKDIIKPINPVYCAVGA